MARILQGESKGLSKYKEGEPLGYRRRHKGGPNIGFDREKIGRKFCRPISGDGSNPELGRRNVVLDTRLWTKFSSVVKRMVGFHIIFNVGYRCNYERYVVFG
jgi:hypothetical protein